MEKIIVRCTSCNALLKIAKQEGSQSLTCPRCQFRGIVSQFPVVVMKKISCPSCNAVLSVEPDRKGIVACPHCKQQRDVADYPEAIARQDGAATELPAREQGGSLSRPGVLVWEKGDVPAPGQVIILKKGINTIGRSKQCSLGTEIADDFISRIHACIELVERADGMFQHILSDAGSKNGTYLNNARLAKGEAFILQPGDLIRVGHTIYKFTLT